MPVPLRARAGEAVAAGVEEVGNRLAVVVRSQPTRLMGALSEQDGRPIAAAADLALRMGRPLVIVVASSGANITEGLPSLHGWGLAARSVVRCSGIVPIVMIVSGSAVSAPALLLGVADIVIACEGSVAYVSGPSMVEEMTGVRLTPEELGGSRAHLRSSGVASLVAADAGAAMELAGDVLDHLPANTDEEPPRWANDDPPDRPTPELLGLLPPSTAGAYDVRVVGRAIVDDGELLELRAQYAPHLFTALGRVGGRPVGIVANQPSALAGTLDIIASQKGAAFVNFCDTANLPIVTLVDTPGFFPGKDLEWRGMIRHGAELAFAYARATVPRVCLILRKAYGGAYIVMDCKSMGNDLCMAWPSAEVAVMGAKGAVEILHRRASVDERAARQAEYEGEFLTPWVAAERGYVDAVIDPTDTRAVVAGAVGLLCSKRELLAARKHANTPV